MALKLFKIDIDECNFHAFSYAATPAKALKDAAKIELERRGRKCFSFDKREFINACALVNYLKKKGTLETVCREQPRS